MENLTHSTGSLVECPACQEYQRRDQKRLKLRQAIYRTAAYKHWEARHTQSNKALKKVLKKHQNLTVAMGRWVDKEYKKACQKAGLGD